MPTAVVCDENDDVWHMPSKPLMDHRYVPIALPSQATNFAEYVTTLPPWEAELLQFTELTRSYVVKC